MCPSLCANIYTAPVYKGWPSSSFSVQGVSKFVHMLCTNWTLAWAHVYISKQFPSLGTPTFTAVLDTAIALVDGKRLTKARAVVRDVWWEGVATYAILHSWMLTCFNCVKAFYILGIIRESVDSLCTDGADAQYIQYLRKSRTTSPQIY